MKPVCTAIAFCVLAAGCNPQGIVDPRPPDSPGPGPFSLTGHIQTVDGIDVSGALVQLQREGSSRTTSSDALGAYRFDDVSTGLVVISVSKDGYVATTAREYIAANREVNFWLVNGIAGPRPDLQLVVGTPLRAIVQSPPCDPGGWDERALCERVAFTPPATGTYELVLTWNGTNELDLLFDDNFSTYFSMTSPGLLRATIAASAGVQRTLRIHSYYGPQTFELTASLKMP
jgi:hypothetical protein